jgi:N2-acetyl-L-2,4-diaminobutanoate deacetylase
MLAISNQEKATRVSCDVDYEADGKQFGHLSMPFSRDESGGGTLMIPIAVIKNGPGPSLLFTGGNHGDEYEGPVTLMNLARELQPKDIRGRVILLPCMNLPAVLNSSRCSPIDGKNMNRIFPGHRNGTITEVIAHYVSTCLLPLVEAVFDLHAGGKSAFIIPSVMMHYLPDPDLMDRTLAALKAFRAPVSVVIEEPDTDGMFDTVVENQGKVFICAELGGAGVLTPESLKVARAGVRNILVHYGMVDDQPTTPGWHRWADSRLVEVPDANHSSSTPHDGLFEPLVEVGDSVRAGQPLARIHRPEELDREPTVILAKVDGLVFVRHAATKVFKGDGVITIARPSTRW